jgi:putative oxidoreductase
MQHLMLKIKNLLEVFDATGHWIGPLVLRLILAKEFWDASIKKLDGANWFNDIQAQFPFPFNLFSPEFSWHLATGFEILGALVLVLGLGTRFFAFSLSILTLVAIATVHAGHGYTLSEGGWKLPLIYLAMLLPLILSGPGKLSIDHRLRLHFLKIERRLWS